MEAVPSFGLPSAAEGEKTREVPQADNLHGDRAEMSPGGSRREASRAGWCVPAGLTKDAGRWGLLELLQRWTGGRRVNCATTSRAHPGSYPRRR